jgi:HEPN domain-containing protein
MASSHDLAVQLLRRAREDQSAATAMLPIADVADAIVCFHAQQAVEKALKAVLATREIEFPFTHDLRLLMGRCEQAGISLPAELSEVDLLTPYAAELRYDDDASGSMERETALSWATVAVRWAREQLDLR